MTDQPADDDMPFEYRLRQARSSLNKAGSTSSSDEEGPDLRGEGEAAEGRVRAVAVTGGRIASLELDPRVMRSTPEELAGYLTEALNAALDALRAQASAEQGEAVPDPAVLLERLREVQNEGLRQLSVMSQGINDALASIQDEAYVGGEATFPGLEHLLDQARKVAGTTLGDDAAQDEAGGTGTAAEGQVRVTASGAGRIREIHLEPQALKRASYEVATYVIKATEEALEEARTGAAERLNDIDGANLEARVHAVQDQSVEQLGSFTRTLQALMNSIQKR
jgi:DNA-binding protein YbaB